MPRHNSTTPNLSIVSYLSALTMANRLPEFNRSPPKPSSNKKTKRSGPKSKYVTPKPQPSIQKKSGASKTSKTSKINKSLLPKVSSSYYKGKRPTRSEIALRKVESQLRAIGL